MKQITAQLSTMHKRAKSLHQSAMYQIKVQGWLGQDWSEWFDNMTITHEDRPDEPVTVFTGCLIDQSALYGLLNKLSNLGLPLLAVNRLESVQTQGEEH